MKLHEKLLTHYLSCGSPVDKEGYLYKKRERTGSYQKRWFVLKGNLLFYQERPGEQAPLGVLVLEGCSVQLCDSEEEFAFSLVFSATASKTYWLVAEDQTSQEGWIKVLLLAQHSFLALLVEDLERQYNEARSQDHVLHHRSPPSTCAGCSNPDDKGKMNVAAENGAKCGVRKTLSIDTEFAEDFCTLHRLYGSEVKQLMAEWEAERRPQQSGASSVD